MRREKNVNELVEVVVDENIKVRVKADWEVGDTLSICINDNFVIYAKVQGYTDKDGVGKLFIAYPSINVKNKWLNQAFCLDKSINEKILSAIDEV